MLEFSSWLQDMLDTHGWSQADLAREAKVTRAAINGILQKRRMPGADLSNAIARALKLSPQEVFYKANLMDQPPNFDPNESRLLHRLSLLSKDEKLQVDDFVEFLLRKKRKDTIKNDTDNKSERAAHEAALKR